MTLVAILMHNNKHTKGEMHCKIQKSLEENLNCNLYYKIFPFCYLHKTNKIDVKIYIKYID